MPQLMLQQNTFFTGATFVGLTIQAPLSAFHVNRNYEGIKRPMRRHINDSANMCTFVKGRILDNKSVIRKRCSSDSPNSIKKCPVEVPDDDP